MIYMIWFWVWLVYYGSDLLVEIFDDYCVVDFFDVVVMFWDVLYFVWFVYLDGFDDL